MTGAGSAEVAYSVEDSFRTLAGTPVWKQPGENISVGSASIENALNRARQPDDPRPDGSREGNVEGALSVTFDMTDTDFHDLIFADGGTQLAQMSAFAPTATWYISSDTGATTEERFLSGAAVESVSINYAQGDSVTVELTIIYADEPEVGGTHGSAPATISQPTKDEIVKWHGTDFKIDGVTVSDLQSLSLEISGMARFRRGQSRFASDVVVGAYEPSLTVQAILHDDTQQSYAYGGATATSPSATTIDETPATLAFANPNGSLGTYTLSGLQPTSYDWSDLVSADTDTTDPTNYHVKDVSFA